jgi:hypothetical protein
LKKEIAEEMDNIFKRIWSNLRDGLAPEPPVRLGHRVEIGRADVYLPNGWQLLKRSEDVVVARSPNGQQATVSLLRANSEISFDAFKRLCDIRRDLEKQGCTEGFSDAKPPFVERNAFHLLFFGEDKQNSRLFSGHLSSAQQELVTIYVEGVGVDPRDHLPSFAVPRSRSSEKVNAIRAEQ